MRARQVQNAGMELPMTNTDFAAKCPKNSVERGSLFVYVADYFPLTMSVARFTRVSQASVRASAETIKALARPRASKV